MTGTGPAAAVSALSAALAADPGRADLWVQLAGALVAAGRPREAWDAAVRAVELAPGEPGSHRVIGAVAVALDDRRQAESAYRHALLLDPADTLARTALSRLTSHPTPEPRSGRRRAPDPDGSDETPPTGPLGGLPTQRPGGRRRAPEPELDEPTGSGRRRAPELDEPAGSGRRRAPDFDEAPDPLFGPLPGDPPASGGRRRPPEPDEVGGRRRASEPAESGGGRRRAEEPAESGGQRRAPEPAESDSRRQAPGPGPVTSTVVAPTPANSAWPGSAPFPPGPVPPPPVHRGGPAVVPLQADPDWSSGVGAHPAGPGSGAHPAGPGSGAPPVGATRWDVAAPGSWRRGLVAVVRLEWVLGVLVYLGLVNDRIAPYTAGAITGVAVLLGGYVRIRWLAAGTKRPPAPDRTSTVVAAAAAALILLVVPAVMLGALTAARATAVAAVTCATIAAALLTRRPPRPSRPSETSQASRPSHTAPLDPPVPAAPLRSLGPVSPAPGPPGLPGHPPGQPGRSTPLGPPPGPVHQARGRHGA